MLNLETQSLRKFQQNPKLLIPEKLYSLSNHPENITAVPLSYWEGTADHGYTLPLAILIAEKNALKPCTLQEKDDPTRDSLFNWERLINRYRIEAIVAKNLTEADFVYALLIADHLDPFGVKIKTYAQALNHRKQGLGKSFFNHLGNLLKKAGYLYYWGFHNPENIGFFTKIGAYPATNIQPERFGYPNLDIPFYYHNCPEVTVSFLNRTFEEQCVKQEFLKPI